MTWEDCRQAAADWIGGQPLKRFRVLRRLRTARDLGRVLWALADRPEPLQLKYESHRDLIIEMGQVPNGSWKIARQIAEQWEAAEQHERRMLLRRIRTARTAARVLAFLGTGASRMALARNLA